MKTTKKIIVDLFRKAAKHSGLIALTDEERAFIDMALVSYKSLQDLIPSRMQNTLIISAHKRAVIDSFGAGEQVASVFALEDLFPNLTALGVTIEESSSPVHKLPVPGSVGSQWVDTNENNIEGSDSISQITFNPLRVSHSQPYSSLLLGQASPDAILKLIYSSIRALETKLLATIFGVGGRTSKTPQGIGYKITSGTDTRSNAVVPTYETLLAMEEAIFEAEVPSDRLAYVTNMRGRNILKNRKVEPGDGALGLMDTAGRVNGYPCLVLNAASKVAGADGLGNLLTFGNWSDLVITRFGQFTVVIDPLTKARQNTTLIHVNGHFDVKGARGTALTSSDESSNVDEYANSFASVAIKS